MTSWTRELEVVQAAVREAGALALQGFGSVLEIEHKPRGEGPVSQYDRACDALLRDRLHAAFPGDALLTEESTDDGAWHTASRVWMIDPIDGTQEYVTGVPEFAVMVGLCVDGVPTVGAVFAPAQELLLLGAVELGARIWRGHEVLDLAVATAHTRGAWHVAVSRSHPSSKVDRICQNLPAVQQVPRGSVGLKIASVSTGESDLYLAATGKVKLWDTCGPAAVLAAAGGVMVDLFGKPLDYVETLTHPRGILACPAAFVDELLAVTRPLAAEFYGEPGA
ncbi:MAG: 3'(2'),5'-bisphosphate nucleotidase CysQ [Pseudomonadota bacterium]